MTDDFKWLVTLVQTTAREQLPRVLIFFNNVNTLSDAYAYVTVKSGQLIGDSAAYIVMYHLNTFVSLKTKILNDLVSPNGNIKIVFCSSSLSMGLNLSGISHIIHYGPPTTCDAFFQETGRASREKESHGHSIMFKFPRMASGRKLDRFMKSYVADDTGCLRNIVLAKFDAKKPGDQKSCCTRCEPNIECDILDRIRESYDSSITESFSDSDVASAGSVESLDDI